MSAWYSPTGQTATAALLGRKSFHYDLPMAAPKPKPTLSIVIPAYNEAQEIEATVRAARRAADALGQPYEVVVVDDASEDDTSAIATAAGARVVPARCRQIAATRNAGAAAALGEVLVFVDADTLLPPRTLAEAWAAIERGCVGGGSTVAFDEQASMSSRAAAATWGLLARIMKWAAGSFLFVRKSVFDAAGGFDERFFAAEEIVMSQRISRYGPFAVVGCLAGARVAAT